MADVASALLSRRCAQPFAWANSCSILLGRAGRAKQSMEGRACFWTVFDCRCFHNHPSWRQKALKRLPAVSLPALFEQFIWQFLFHSNKHTHIINIYIYNIYIQYIYLYTIYIEYIYIYKYNIYIYILCVKVYVFLSSNMYL